MNDSPLKHNTIRRKQISLLTNSTHYLLDKNKELEDFNNFKSNTFYLDTSHQNKDQKIQIESYIDLLIKKK